MFYALKNKYTGKVAMVEVCGEAVYLVDDEAIGDHAVAFVYTETTSQKIQDTLDGVNDNLFVQIDPEQYDIVEFILK
ncbi:hypothetical protein [Aeromonas phage AS-zj]|uniref:Uncharacterized protein n=2 Tax=Ceceduovirus aszj TaxID=2843652 RepID=A0A291LD42_9CAUD|nr:hypothetical protein HWB28_gp223 [Aeromonas phage AS-zj]ASU00329.1 hypothetical protein [Aeromonas phage AS-zj]ATI17261.1 hypothetical protein [Aeromonas phage AS-szw]QAX98854.1 hypothetical protein assk_51 [Aeromonas phage Assk]